jgi:hypothetical protein
MQRDFKLRDSDLQPQAVWFAAPEVATNCNFEKKMLF